MEGSIAQLRSAVRQQSVSADGPAGDAQRRVATFQDTLNSFTSIDADGALAA